MKKIEWTKENYNNLALLLFLSGLGALVYLSVPGKLCVDSMAQYQQSLTRSYEDWHPPMMSFVWANLMDCGIGRGSETMLFFHFGMLTAGVLALFYNFKAAKFNFLFLSIPFWPQISSISNIIYKDVGMALAFLLLTILWLTELKKYQVIILRILAAGFFFYAFSVRANAITAAFPFIFYLIKFHKPQLHLIKIFFIAVIISLSLYGGVKIFNSHILMARQTNPSSLMRADEIAVLSHVVGQNLFCQASGISELPLSQIPDAQGDFDFYFNRIKNGGDNWLWQNWLDAVTSHPESYLKAKFILFCNCSDFSQAKAVPSVFTTENNLFFYLNSSRLNGIFPILFKPYFWSIIAAFLFFAGYRRKDRYGDLLQMISASSIFYYIGYLLVTPDGDYRFFYWTNLAAIVALLFWLCTRNMRENQGKSGR